MPDMKLSVIVRGSDQLSSPIRRMMETVERSAQRAERGVSGLGSSVDRLGRSGAHLDGLLNRLRRLGREAVNVREHFSRLERGLDGLSRYGAAAAAGGYVLGKPITNAMQYDLRLAYMTNTAFSDQDVKGRIAGKKMLEAAIAKAVRYGGGAKYDAATALDFLISSGAVSNKNAIAMLPEIMKAATASESDPREIAAIGVRTMQNFGMRATDLPGVIDMATKAGQLGGFELKDMAKWLPQIMAAGSQSGMKGKNDLAVLLSAAEASSITAGTTDEAGNNLVNLLYKINSSDTARDAKKLGIDLSGTLAAARAKGVNPLEAFVKLTDRIVEKNAQYMALKRQADSAKTPEDKKATLQAMAGILEGSAIGKIVQDRQALGALIGIMNNPDAYRRVKQGIGGDAATGANDANFAVVKETAAFKWSQAKAEADLASVRAFEKLNPVIGDLSGKAIDLARKHEQLAAAAVAATTALGALAASSALLKLLDWFKGGKIPIPGKLPLPGGKPTPPAPESMWDRMAPKPKTLPPPSMLRKAAPLLGVYGLTAAGGYEIGYQGAKVYDHMTRQAPGAGPVNPDLLRGSPLAITNQIILDSRQIAESVNTFNTQTARRN